MDMTSDNNGKLHCTHGDLTDSFGWLVQGILACLAFMCLIVKRFCEPRKERRPWIIWFYDTSKQGLGALVIHFANVFLAEFFQGDPCTWYIVSYLLDSSLGLFFIFVGIRLTQRIARRKGCPLLIFGEYGKPPQPAAWLAQCGAYVGLMLVEKILITLLIQLDFWDKVRDFIMSPIKDPKVELAIVVLVVPFFINVMMFWVVDNFLMHKHGRWRDEEETQHVGVNKSKARYSTTDQLSECEVLLMAGEDEEIDTNKRHRSSLGSTIT